jgi:transcriptional regulator with XRE-family HTH domain
MAMMFAPPTCIPKPGAMLKAQGAAGQIQLTLADVSRRTGFTTSTLSKMENDKTSLTFEKLVRLSAWLHVDVFALFGEMDSRPDNHASGRRSIMRGGEGKAIETKNSFNLYPACDLLNKSMIPVVAELPAHRPTSRPRSVSVSEGRARAPADAPGQLHRRAAPALLAVSARTRSLGLTHEIA